MKLNKKKNEPARLNIFRYLFYWQQARHADLAVYHDLPQTSAVEPLITHIHSTTDV